MAALGDLPPDFNSSDFEISDVEQQVQKKRKSGHGIAEAILRNQAVDRRESKKSLRTLTFAHGAPGTQVHHESVIASWDAFCQTISHDPTVCPTGDDIYRYIDTIVRNTKTRLAGKSAASLSVIRSIWARLIKLLKFRHEKLLKSYTPHHVTRIEVHLQQLVTQGKLIHGTWFKKQWVSFMTLLKMTETWFAYALKNGTHSWDVTLLKVIVVVVQSALSSRSGDIARSQLYAGLECLCWKDITLKLDSASDKRHPSVQDLRGEFLLRYTKGAKNTMNNDKPIFCDPLENPAQSTACPIKLLLILALRLGRVHGSTVEECLQHAARRADATIQWTSPDAAVFPQMKGNSSFLVLDKPAGQEQVRFSLQQIAQVVGILDDRIDTKALRRGALRDQAYAKKVIAGVATRATAMIAGHSNKSYARGTTRDYVGALEEPMFNLRAEQPREDRMAPAFALEAPSSDWLQERATRYEIDNYMKAREMDVDDLNQRKRAGKQMKTQRGDAWRAAARNQPAVTDHNTPAQPLRQRSTTEVNARPGQRGTATPLLRPTDDETQKYFSETPRTLVSEAFPTDDDADALLLDPQLRAYDQMEADLKKAALQRLTDSVFLHPGEDEVDSTDAESYHCPEIPAEMDSVDSAMLDDQTSAGWTATPTNSTSLEPTQELELSQILTLSGNDFTQFFSRINIFQKQISFDRNNEEELRKYVPSGNSRDLPTSFLYHCTKGCGLSVWCRQHLNDHTVNCIGQPTTKLFQCPRHGCDKSYKTENSLKLHITNDHEFKAVACAQCPEEPGVLYSTRNDLQRHRRNAHGGIEEQLCPLQDQCHSTVKFTSKTLLKQHLRRMHHLTSDELKEHVPDGRKGHHVNKGRKRKPIGWHLRVGNDDEDEVDE